MIVNKFIIALCIIFLVLLLRKLTYENFQSTPAATTTPTAITTQPVFSTTLNYNCASIDNDDVCDFLEQANICNNTSLGCKPACRFDITNQEFLKEIDDLESSNQKFSHCLSRCQVENENSYCTNQDCLDVCNNLNLSATENLLKYRARDSSDTSDRHYEQLVNKITSLPEDDPLMHKILTPLKEYSNSQSSVDKEKELRLKIENLNKASSVLATLNDTNIEVNKDIPEKMMTHLENLLRKKRKLNEDLDYNVKANMIKEKINRIKQLTNYFSEQGQTSNGNSLNKMHGVFKSIRCIANGQTLNIEAVIQSVDDGNSETNLFVKRNKEYLIQVNDNILFYELRNTSPNDVLLDDKRTISSGMVCRGELNEDANGVCKFVPSNGYYKSSDGISINNNVDLNGRVVGETQWNNLKNDRQFKAVLQQIGAYFKVNKISNKMEYNNVIKRAGNLNYESGLIKYPFYIVQPVNHPDKCLNLKKTNTGTNIVTIEKCSNNPTERFDAHVYSSYNPNCQTQSS